MMAPEEVVKYWVEDLGPSGWYAGGEDLDARIRARFEPIWKEAREGALGLWLTSAVGTLAYIIVTDQMPRNMFRYDKNAFETDNSARAAAKLAIERDWDQQIAEPERQFFYMPLMHSESLIDQDRCMRLLASRMPETGPDTMRHARVHREIIRLFGRFPYRNEALGRKTTAAEKAWMEAGGYATTMRAVEDANA